MAEEGEAAADSAERSSAGTFVEAAERTAGGQHDVVTESTFLAATVKDTRSVRVEKKGAVAVAAAEKRDTFQPVQSPASLVAAEERTAYGLLEETQEIAAAP